MKKSSSPKLLSKKKIKITPETETNFQLNKMVSMIYHSCQLAGSSLTEEEVRAIIIRDIIDKKKKQSNKKK